MIITFVVMGERGLTEALTSDHHFEQAGFTALLKAPCGCAATALKLPLSEPYSTARTSCLGFPAAGKSTGIRLGSGGLVSGPLKNLRVRSSRVAAAHDGAHGVTRPTTLTDRLRFLSKTRLRCPRQDATFP